MLNNGDIKCRLVESRIGYLDAIKCLGIILVIEGHVRGYGMNMGAYDSLSSLMLYSFNMPMFFFVSGLLAYKVQDYALKKIVQHSFKKFVCLVLPTLFFFIFRTLLLQKSPLDLFKNGFGGYWFTITLWECFMIYYMLLLLFKKSSILDMLLIILALTGLFFLSVFSEYGPKLLDINRLTKYFHFFVWGVLSMKYKIVYEKLMNCEWLKMIAIVGFFGILVTVYYGSLPAFVFHFLRDIVLRYFGLFVVISWFACHAEFFNSSTSYNKIILGIGRKSLPFYLLQYFFLPDLHYMDGVDVITTHIISFTYTFIILVVCSVFISLLSNSKIIKRYVLGQK